MKNKPISDAGSPAPKTAGAAATEPVSIQALAARYPNPSRPLFRAEDSHSKREPDRLKRAW